MKPKYRTFIRKALPALIILPVMTGLTSAAIITPNPVTGNVLVTTDPGDSGPNNIQTGFFPAPGNNEIRINAGAFVNPVSGDAVEVQTFDASGAFYTIYNNGTLSALGGNPGEHGIDTIDMAGATPTISVNNTGTISGFSAIRANNTLTLVNDGTITGIGFSDGAVFAKNGATINNNYYGTITGNVHGIQSQLVSGILDIYNDGSITGTNFDGISSPGIVQLLNDYYGTVTGSRNGVLAGADAEISNYGTITGTNDSGIRAGDNADIFNYDTITGGVYGINLGTSTSGSVYNTSSSLISGGQYGILGDTGAETVTNFGTITGSLSALQLNGGANIVNLNDGSVLNGDARASGGSLDITMNGGLTSPFDSTQNIINGGVFNATTLNKTGSGMAVVTGTTAADSISVTGGYLYLRDNVTNAAGGENAISANGGAIGGLGTWDSAITLTNGASISPGTNPLALTNTVTNSIGTLNVTGDVTLDSTSDYVWNVNPFGGSDRINLTGAGNVFTTNNSDFVISPTDVNTHLLDGSTIVVDTQDTLVGSFDSISVASFPSTTPDTGLFQANQINPIIAEYFTTLTKINSSQDWELTIAHDYSIFGSTANEVAAGEMLNDLVNTTSDSDVEDLLAAMDYSDESVTEGVLAALDPGAYMATAAALATNNYHLHRTVENHNAAVRAGSSAIVGSQGSSAKGEAPAPMMVSGCGGCTNVWGSFSYDWQDLETSNSSFDQDGDVYSFTAGIDFTVAENFRLGLVAEGSQSDMDGDYNLGSEVESYRFAAYANWGSATGWFVDALLGYNTHSVDQSRSTFMALAATESASYDADGWQGLINAGYAFETSAGTFSPYLGLEWQQLSVDSFDTEDGPLPISVGGYDVDSFRALAGVRWEADLTASVKGYASATYAFEFEDDAADTTVEFGGGSYRASGMELGDAVLLSAGIRWGVATCTTLDVGYRGEFAMDDGVDSNGANIGLNYSF